jgi:hypothetical protein
MATTLEVAEGIQYQYATEELIYTVTTTNWGSSPSSLVVTAYEEGSEKDVTATVFPTNSPTAANDIISLSPMKALTKGKTYRVEVKFTSGSNKFEPYFRVRCIT